MWLFLLLRDSCHPPQILHRPFKTSPVLLLCKENVVFVFVWIFRSQIVGKAKKNSNNCPFLRKLQNWDVFGLFFLLIIIIIIIMYFKTNCRQLNYSFSNYKVKSVLSLSLVVLVLSLGTWVSLDVLGQDTQIGILDVLWRKLVEYNIVNICQFDRIGSQVVILVYLQEFWRLLT